MGARFEREIGPGELVEINAGGLRSHSLNPLAPAEPARCIFELVYVSRPDSLVFGQSVERFRRRTGAILAAKAPVDADVVMPVPRSGISAAIGYAASPEARARGITYEQGLLTNAYSGLSTGFRTFIQPTAREAAAVLKYSVVESVVRGRDLILVDDSVVRGSFRRIAEKLRASGARSIHLRVASPPLAGGCFYGVDFGSGELLAHRIPDLAERAAYLGVDSLVHLSWRELVAAATDSVPAPTAGPEDPAIFGLSGFCGACFTQHYPTDVGGVIPKEDGRSNGESPTA
jgi:amidophosphoribosyltransferase